MIEDFFVGLGVGLTIGIIIGAICVLVSLKIFTKSN